MKKLAGSEGPKPGQMDLRRNLQQSEKQEEEDDTQNMQDHHQ